MNSDFNINPTLMTAEEFNSAVKQWTADRRMKAVGNVNANTDKSTRQWKKRTTPKLARSISGKVKKNNGVAERIAYAFERHGVFFHYGVGRGYIKVGNSLVRGYRIDSSKELVAAHRKKGDKDKDIKMMKHAYKHEGHMIRKPVNWMDVELDKGLYLLADIAQEFYGDKAMKDVLSQIDKIKITKSSKSNTILV